MHQDSLKTVLDMVERQKNGQLTIERLAVAAYMSASRLQSLFKQLTGQSLMDYVRGRKLAHSLHELFNTNMRIIDIAHQYGFSHEQSYMRAFQSEFDCPPGKARRQKLALPIREQIVYDSIIETGVGLIVGPEHIVVPEFHIIGIPTVLRGFDVRRDGMAPNAAGRAAYFDILSKLPNVNPDIYYGVNFYLGGNDYEYMPSVGISGLNGGPKELKRWTFPAGRYVRFRYTGEHPPEECNIIDAKETYMAVNHFFKSQARYLFPENFHYERISPPITTAYSAGWI
ncbi:MAG: helix-turn-helix domain-containing protein [Oscillospiraceae bacterium]|nr:helix-turn-helix domain-containing protein [Oscillospiraceae bacterium]